MIFQASHQQRLSGNKMNKILITFLWIPLKFFLSFLPQHINIFLKRRIINFLSYFGYSNSQNRMDKSIIKFFDFKKNGICLEVGAWDFDTFNNYAEIRGWKFIQKIGNDYLYSLVN